MTQLPNLFVPGFPKAGTTSICAALGRHPAVYAPYTKEPHHWASDFGFYAEREGMEKRSVYLDLYARMSKEHIYGLDGSTLYLYSEEAIPAIVNAVPDPKFIVCVREVRSMIAAWHGQMLAGGYEEVEVLAQAWSASASRRAGSLVPAGCPDSRLLDYERIGLQGAQLDRLLEHVPAESVLVIRMNDLAAEPAAVLSRCLEFLGLHDDGSVGMESKNAAFAVRRRWLRRLLYAPSVKRPLNRVLNAIGPSIASPLREVARRVAYRKAVRRTPDERAFEVIETYFAEDQRRLEALLAAMPHASSSTPDGRSSV